MDELKRWNLCIKEAENLLIRLCLKNENADNLSDEYSIPADVLKNWREEALKNFARAKSN